MALRWITVKHREAIQVRGGGSLASAIQAAVDGAQREVVEALKPFIDQVMMGAVLRWPIGPERPWEPGHIHSITRFQLRDESRGWFVRLVIVNEADYVLFIHRPGAPGRLVAKEEIEDPLEDKIPEIEAAARAAVEQAFRDSGLSR